MAHDIESELIDSVKSLFDNPEYSDLKITTRWRDYHGHKAIVCPRSEFLADECRKAYLQVSLPGSQKTAVVDLHDDDPQIADMAIRYLYCLNYPSLTIDEVGKAAVVEEVQPSMTEQGDAHPYEPGHSPGPGSDTKLSEQEVDHTWSLDTVTHSVPKAEPEPELAPDPEPVAQPVEEVVPEPASAETPEFDFSPPPTSTKKKKKKLAKGKSVRVEARKAPEPESEVVKDTVAAWNWDPPAPEPEPEVKETVQESMRLHARVYILATKYGIRGLRDLALSKLAAKAMEDWDTGEFLETADEVYRDRDAGHGALKIVVMRTVAAHLELLDKEEMASALRNLDLAADLLLHLRRNGRIL